VYHSFQFSLAPEGVADLVLVRPKPMVKLVIGFVLGVCAVVIVGWLVGYDAYSLGRFHEEMELGWKIPDALGRDIDPNEPMQPLWGGKDRSVVIVTRHGVKTLRLCCDGSEPKPTP
jgi:hypothetical protein